MLGACLGGDLWWPGSSVWPSEMLCLFISLPRTLGLGKNLHLIHESLIDKPERWFVNM